MINSKVKSLKPGYFCKIEDIFHYCLGCPNNPKNCSHLKFGFSEKSTKI